MVFLRKRTQGNSKYSGPEKYIPLEKGFKSGMSVDSHEHTELTTKSVPLFVKDAHAIETKTKQL
jgi:hypothetical protein